MPDSIAQETWTVIRAFMIGVAALAAFGAAAATPEPIAPYEQSTSFEPVNPIDAHVLARLKAEGMAPAALCSDAVFVRRVYLDAIGTLPTVEQVRRFLDDERPDKRARLIDELLEREAFIDYWTLKWCDLLRVKAEHPINLWPNGVQAYHRWIRASVASNQPYDRFARELLTSSGSNFRVPPVNYYRAVQGQEPEAIAAAVGLTFMGVRVEQWPADRRAELEKFFARVGFKGTAEWKEEVVHLDPTPVEPTTATLPDGTKVRLEPEQDPRVVFADWLIRPDNPWFTRNIANRAWAWLFGRGIVHEPDDLRPDNPPVNPALLAYLEQELTAGGYDLKHLFRLILNSRTYQQSSIPRSDDARATARLACYPVRRIDAEVLVDALDQLFGFHESYESHIPEPFTFVPEHQRTIALGDGSITSPVLEMFGRPARDTGLESERTREATESQRLYLLNSSDLQRHIERSGRVRRAGSQYGRDAAAAVDGLYLAILSRHATEAEVAAVQSYIESGGVNTRQGVADLAWALVNSREFLYRH